MVLSQGAQGSSLSQQGSSVQMEMRDAPSPLAMRDVALARAHQWRARLLQIELWVRDMKLDAGLCMPASAQMTEHWRPSLAGPAAGSVPASSVVGTSRQAAVAASERLTGHLEQWQPGAQAVLAAVKAPAGCMPPTIDHAPEVDPRPRTAPGSKSELEGESSSEAKLHAMRQSFSPDEWRAQAAALQAEGESKQHQVLGQLSDRYGLGSEYEPVSSKSSVACRFSGGLRDTAAQIIGPGDQVYQLETRMYWMLDTKTHRMSQAKVTVVDDGKGCLQRLDGKALVPFKPHADPVTMKFWVHSRDGDLVEV